MISARLHHHLHQFFPLVSSDATGQIVEQRRRYKNPSVDVYQIFPSPALRSIVNHNAIFHLCRDRHAGKINKIIIIINKINNNNKIIIILQLINKMKRGKIKRQRTFFRYLEK